MSLGIYNNIIIGFLWVYSQYVCIYTSYWKPGTEIMQFYPGRGSPPLPVYTCKSQFGAGYSKWHQETAAGSLVAKSFLADFREL